MMWRSSVGNLRKGKWSFALMILCSSDLASDHGQGVCLGGNVLLGLGDGGGKSSDDSVEGQAGERGASRLVVGDMSLLCSHS